VNLIDTALMYPGSEEFIGNHLSHRRSDYIIVSKCGGKVPGVDAKEWTPAVISAAVDRALRLLKTDRLDVMLLHSCDLKTLQADDCLEALVQARDAGKIGFAGYSGDNEAAEFAAKLPDIAVIETSVNIVDQHNIDVVLPVARQNDVGIIAKRPIANAAWKPIDQHLGLYKTYARTYVERFAKLGLTPSDLGFDGSPEQVWPEIALRFTLSFPEVNVAIVGTTNVANALRNVEVVEKGPLPADAVEKLRDAFVRAQGSDRWLGQT
jgi:aryl-alcohol dehydrogenase-like predicted oxidoreductase